MTYRAPGLVASLASLALLLAGAAPPPLAAQAGAEMAVRPTLTLAAAERLVDEALQRARERGWRMVIAVVDDGGHPIHLVRMDGAQLGSVEIALEKARGAVRFRRPTADPAAWVRGNPAMLGLPGIVPVAGGVPLWADDELVGAVGVSGATASEDALLADAAASAAGFPVSGSELPRRR